MNLKPLNEIMWCAVRESEKRYLDINTLSLFYEVTKRKAKEVDNKLPIWAKDNPVICFVCVDVNPLSDTAIL
jgi:hypothetical protein